MNIDHRNPRLRRGFAFVALAAVVGLAAVGLTQCRLVGDNVTGVDLQSNSGASARSDCVRSCNESRKACFRAENARYKAAVAACAGDNGCKKAQQRLHQDNHKACVNASQLCKRNCYNEGGGSAGR